MNNVELIIFIAAPVIALLFIYGSTLWNMFITWRAPLTWISAMPSTGWVEVTGHVRGETKTSLLTKTPCVYWQVEVQEWRSSGRGGGYWRTTLVNSSGPFEIDDGTGRVQVEEGKPSLLLQQEICIENPEGDERTTLEALGVKFTGLLGFKKKTRVFERTLSLDDELLVVGKAAPKQSLNVLAGASITPRLISDFGKQQTISTLFMRRTRAMVVAIIVLVIWEGFMIFALTQT